MTANANIPFSLPARALSLKPGAFAGPKGGLLAVPILLLIGAIIVWWQAPGLVRDWQIYQNPVVVDGDVRNGQCKTRRGFFTDCEADVSYSYGGETYRSHVELMFVDFHSGDYEVEVVISGDKPELATLSLGIDKIWNRVIVFGLFTLLLLGGALFMLFKMLQARSASNAFTAPAKLSLTPVSLGVVAKTRGGSYISYTDKSASRSIRGMATKFTGDQKPLMALDEKGEAFGVAVKREGAGPAALLDRGLQRIDLTENERREALEQVTARYGQSEIPVAAPATAEKQGFNIKRRIFAFFGIILLIVAAITGYWFWYVIASPTQFDQIGMEINNILPEPINNWGCSMLEQRFSDDRAPFGCTAEDHRSWK